MCIAVMATSGWTLAVNGDQIHDSGDGNGSGGGMSYRQLFIPGVGTLCVPRDSGLECDNAARLRLRLAR